MISNGDRGIFRYSATRLDGSRTRGSVIAGSNEDALQILSTQGLLVTKLSSGSWGITTLSRRATLSDSDAASVLRTLADLLGSGLSVSKALDAAVVFAPARWRATQPTVRKLVLEGTPLSDALAQAERPLPAIAVAVVRSHERVGDLAAGVKSAAKLLESQEAWRREAVGAILYPAVLLVTAMLVLTGMIVYVLPRIISLLAESGQAIPSSTRALMSIATAAPTYSAAAILSTFAVGALLRALPARSSIHASIAATKLALPGVGPLIHGRETARFCSALSASLGAGIPLYRAMGDAASVLHNLEVLRRLRCATTMISEGASLHVALDSHAVLSPRAIAILGAGERAGSLTAMSERAAAVEAASVQRRVQAATRFAEPTLMLIVGALVGLVALAFMEAIYSLQPGIV